MFSLLLTILSQAAPLSAAPHADQCWTTEVSNGTALRVYGGDRKCVSFHPPGEMTGIWVNEFEGSAFYAGAKTLADTRGKKGDVWLSMDGQTVLPANFRRHYGRAYRITIVGRTALDMNRAPLEGYGHMGMSRGLVLVDRVIDSQDLGPARDR